MKENNRIVKELVKFVREQRQINLRLEATDRRLEATDRRLEKMLAGHEKWMRNHEVRLAVHYNEIRELKDKLR